jgi:NhaP-type Na+/H+ or K+/H+ antiporter
MLVSMTFFESLLALMLAAIALLQVSRHLRLPYPSMLAVAGVAIALIPGSPRITLDPHTALALFIAPVLLDAAYDFPVHAAWRYWRPLVALGVFAVLISAAVVAWIGVVFAGLPIAAAAVLGAIVAPPDAAAATAVLGSVALPSTTVTVLKGESLFNDATALILFGAALAIQTGGALETTVALQLAVAAPGGIALGIGFGFLAMWISRSVMGTLGGNLLQFVQAFVVWVVADHLHLSSVLAEVAFGMTVARAPERPGSARMRVHSFAVWSSVVFLLNVLAFLFMGLQARTIIGRLAGHGLVHAAEFAGLVVLGVVVSRCVVVMVWNRLAARFGRLRGDLPPPTLRQGLLVSWSGMRGLVTLATAFALPSSFPQRDLVVLTAFAVVLATLVVQGLTMAPLIRTMKLHQMDDPGRELAEARAALARIGLSTLNDMPGQEAEALRYGYALERNASGAGEAGAWERYCALGRKAIAAERNGLQELRARQRITAEIFVVVQETLDWRELALLPDEERRIEES